MDWYFRHTKCTPFTCIQCSKVIHAQYNFVFGQESASLRLETIEDLAYFAEQAFNHLPSRTLLKVGGFSTFSFGIVCSEQPKPILCAACWLINASIIAAKLGLPDPTTTQQKDYSLPTKGVFANGRAT